MKNCGVYESVCLGAGPPTVLPLIMPKPTSDDPKVKPICFRPTEADKTLLELAEEATGADVSELILDCLRVQLPKIVEQAHIEKTAKRQKALEQFRKAAAQLKHH